jgi:hypothetical protein
MTDLFVPIRVQSRRPGVRGSRALVVSGLLSGMALLTGGVQGAAAQSPPPSSGTVPSGSSTALGQSPAWDFAVQGVRLFDGTAFRGPVTVTVRQGRIVGIEAGGAVGAGLPVVDGSGRTLLPGLIDAHTHTFDRGALEQALAFGVTLHLDMFTAPAFLSPTRGEQGTDGAPHDRADLLGAGYLATAAGGHGTQFGFEVPTVEVPEDASAWVADRVREGADFVKIVVEDGAAHGMSVPSLGEARVRALVRAAHDHGLKAVVHVSTLEQARMALEAGADGLAHLWVDQVPDLEFASEMARAGMFVIPTLAVLEGMLGDIPGPGAAETFRGTPRRQASSLPQPGGTWRCDSPPGATSGGRGRPSPSGASTPPAFPSWRGPTCRIPGPPPGRASTGRWSS